LPFFKKCGINRVKGVFWVAIKEKEQLDEMAFCPISSRSDGLPFKLTVRHPDHRPVHAHIRDLKTGKLARKRGAIKI
jgi:hypothetical protein